MERVVATDPRSDEMGATIMLYSLARLGLENKVQALCVCPGMGEHWRVTDAIRVWESQTKAKHLLIAGHNPAEKTWKSLALNNLQQPPFNLQRTEGVQVDLRPNGGTNTKLQSQWLLEKVRELQISSMAVFVSPYHLLRAFSTVLKTFNKAGVRISLVPVPVIVSPNTIIPESGANAWDSVPGELARIPWYQAGGDVTSYQELREYLSWFWAESPLMAQFRVQ